MNSRTVIRMALPALKDLGVERADLAREAGIALQTLNAFIAGQRNNPETEAKILAAIEAHGITFSQARGSWVLRGKGE